jgi:hypothetical protein
MSRDPLPIVLHWRRPSTTHLHSELGLAGRLTVVGSERTGPAFSHHNAFPSRCPSGPWLDGEGGNLDAARNWAASRLKPRSARLLP